LLHATRSLRATARGASLKPGKSYTPKRIDSAIALMKRDLANQNHLASKVRLDQAHFHPDTNRADIFIDVQPCPIVKVRVTGAKLSWLLFLRGRQMKKLIPIFSEGTVDPVQEMRFWASCLSAAKRQDSPTLIFLRILTRGPRKP
jgi:hypothetical protein